MKKLLFLSLFAVLALAATNPIADIPDETHNFGCSDAIFPGGAYLTIAGKFGGDITISELSEFTSLNVQGCVAGAKVYQFELIIKHGKKSQSFKGSANELSKEMLKKFHTLSKGDEFSFKNVKARVDSTQDVDVLCKKFFVV